MKSEEVAVMNGTFRVGNLFGIPFYVNSSWFFVLILMTVSYGSGLAAQFPNLPAGLPWLWGFLTALLLFASVLAHELGHSFVAIKQGIEVKSISLFLFGGIASLDKESETPGQAFSVAIAGPLVSLVLCGFFTLIGATTGITGAPAAILGLLASINLALALFNLIPGLPLDGGNILKAAVWQITGNPYKGIVFAGRVGQIIGWMAIASGVIPVILSGSLGNFWNILIGFFLLQNAGFAAQSATIQDKLAKFTAADAVSPNSPVVSGEMSLREFANEYVIGKTNWRKFLVTDAEGKLAGTIAVDDLKLVATSNWPQTPVRELLKPAPTNTVKSDQSLLEVVAFLEAEKLTEVPVVNDSGLVLGIVEKIGIKNLLQMEAQSHAA